MSAAQDRNSLARVGWARHSDFMRTQLQETGRIRLSFITLADLWAVVDDLGIDPDEVGFYRGYAVVGDAEHPAAQGREYHPQSLIERRVIALYVVGILLGVAAGFALATMLWGLNEVMQ